MDFISFLIGLLTGEEKGTRHVILEGDGYTFTDSNSDGNIVITGGE